MISSVLRNLAKESTDTTMTTTTTTNVTLFGDREANTSHQKDMYARIRRRVLLLLVLAKVAPPNQLNNLRRNMFAHLHDTTLCSSQIALLSQASVALFRISICDQDIENIKWNFTRGAVESVVSFLSLMLQGVCGNYFTGPIRLQNESMVSGVRLNLGKDGNDLDILNLLRLVLDCCFEVLCRAEHVPTQYRVATYEPLILCQLTSCVSSPLESTESGRRVCSSALKVIMMLSHVLLSSSQEEEAEQSIASKISKEFYQTLSSVASGKRSSFASTVNEQEATAALAVLATSSSHCTFRVSYWNGWWARLDKNLVCVFCVL